MLSEVRFSLTLDRYVCLFYNTKKNSQHTSQVNEERFLLLDAKLSKNGAEETQIIWPSVTQPPPPCLDVLHQKMKRTNMISHKFRNAHKHWCLYWNETDERQLRLISRSAWILILTDRWKSGLAPKPLLFIQLCLHYDTKGNCEVWHGQRGSKLHLTFMKVCYMNLPYPKLIVWS